jgi:signal transduction histidine kinase
MALQDEERRRIARELHDSAGQYLAGILMNLRALMHDANKLGETHTARITDSLAMAELCTSEIRTISYLLHPPLLDEVGLASAISWYVEGFSQRSGIKVELQIQEDIGRLPQDLENALFRIVQQSLANIHRHSGSQVAEIRINLDAESLVAEICDEGRGIPQEMLEGFHDGTRLVGVGMAGMRERIRDMGGHFEVRSSGAGTTIAVRLPLPEMTQAAQAAGA